MTVSFQTCAKTNETERGGGRGGYEQIEQERGKKGTIREGSQKIEKREGTRE